MAIDKGSLRYKIELESQKAIEGLTTFRKELIKSRQSFRLFRRDVSQLGTGARQLKNTLRDLAKVTVQGAEAASKAASSLNKTVAAQRKANTEHRKAVVTKKKLAKETKKLTVVEKERLKLQAAIASASARYHNKELRNLVTRLAVVKKLAAGHQKLALAKKFANTGRDATTGLKFAQVAELKRLEAQNALEREQVLLNNKELQSLNAQLAVTKRIAAAEAARTQSQLLRQRGLTATGLTQGQEASRQFADALERQQIKTLVDEMKRGHPAFAKTDKSLKNIDKRANSLAQSTARLRTGMASLNDIFHKTRSGANRVFFTFRRLIGIFAAFLIIRKVIQGFNALIGGAVKYNAAIEQNILGIASLLTAVSEIRTAAGSSADAQTQLSLAIKESRRQIELLRKEALTTVATFRQLVDTYQIALGPGVAAGLDVDQIRKFTIQISQAAAAIGLAQNQLAEEIRSILSGTIQLRTTRIAAVLGITNADIRRAKEMGVLAEFLDDRFRAFTEAGKEALTLYNAVIARLGDAFNELLRQGSADFFLELKNLLTDVLSTLVEITDEGVVVNPKALEIVNSIFEGLRRAVAEAQRLRVSLNVNDLGAAASALGSGLGNAAEALGAMVEGVIEGFRDMSVFLKPIIDSLKSALPEMKMQEFVRLTTEAVVVVTALKFLLSSTVGVVFFLVGPIIKVVTLFAGLVPILTGIVGGLGTILTLVSSISLPVLGILAAAVALGAAMFIIVDEIVQIATGASLLEVKFGTLVTIIRTFLVAAFKFAAASMRALFLSSTFFVKGLFKSMVAGLRHAVLAVARVGLNIAKLLGKDVTKQLDNLRDRQLTLNKEYVQELKKDGAELAKAYSDLFGAVAGTVKAGKTIAKALATDETAESFEEMADRLRLEAESLLGGLFKEATDSAKDFMKSMEAAGDTSVDLVRGLKELPGIISRGARGILGLGAQLQKLDIELRKTAHALQTAFQSAGLEDSALQQRQTIAENEFRLQEHARQIDERRRELSEQILINKGKILDIDETSSHLSDRDATRVREALRAGQLILTITDKINAAESKRNTSIALQNALKEKGTDEQKRALGESIRLQTVSINDLKKGLLLVETTTSAIASSIGDPKIVQDILDRIRLVGLEKGQMLEIEDLLKERAKLEERLTKITVDRLLTSTKEREISAQQSLRILDAELTAERNLAKFTSSLNIEAKKRELVEATGILSVEKARLTNLKETYDIQIEGNASIIKSLRARGVEEEKIKEIEKGHIASALELLALLELQKELVKRQALEQAEAKRRLEEPISFGLETAVADFSRNALDEFENFVELGKAALEGFADFISQSIADAFDPSSDTSIGERFREFLNMLANLIISQLIKKGLAAALSSVLDNATKKDASTTIAASSLLLSAAAKGLTTAASNLSGATGPWFLVILGLQSAARNLKAAAIVFTAASAGSAAAGGATGGRVAGPAAASPAHFAPGVQGFALGGAIKPSPIPSTRPPGLDVRDRIPIWARVNEWMIRPEAVARYGNKVMDAINRGIIDPALLQGLAGARRAMGVTTPRKQGFATGGRVTSIDTPSAEVSGGIERAVVVADGPTFERLLAAGTSAQMRWLKDHADEVRTIIS